MVTIPVDGCLLVLGEAGCAGGATAEEVREETALNFEKGEMDFAVEVAGTYATYRKLEFITSGNQMARRDKAREQVSNKTENIRVLHQRPVIQT